MDNDFLRAFHKASTSQLSAQTKTGVDFHPFVVGLIIAAVVPHQKTAGKCTKSTNYLLIVVSLVYSLERSLL